MPDVEKKEVFVSALGVKYIPDMFHSPSGTDGKLIHPKLDFDPKTGSTKPNENDTESIYELIQTYADQCGMAYVQKMIASGMLNPDKVADDGKHGGDASLPTDANVGYRASLQNDASITKLERALGIKLGDDTTPEQICDALANIYKNQQAKTQVKEAE